MATKTKSGGCKKGGRSKRKGAAGSGAALSRFVRGEIDFTTYAKQAGVKPR